MLEDNQSSMFRFLIGNASLSQRMVTDKYLSNAVFHLKKKKEISLKHCCQIIINFQIVPLNKQSSFVFSVV